ncbi:AAA family ATPase [Sphingomonas sp. CL5.1]|uniref:AAA family ATPase n=1 Tax=Sphingomonas sp. CL5.1 TaxID=2653203 RepID=UPI0015836F12|nr:AAA family ATPase [Sphingomonas sp. CL5.1]QKS00949.1 AAA family ATPase [Sphingomonas sp. CL5.1]
MTSLRGNAPARAAFDAAMASGALHHAWLLTGPQGVGKGTFAREAAARLLAQSAGDEGGARTRALIEAGSHPDYRELARLAKEERGETRLARSITIAQVRALQPLFATTPSLGPRRVIVIDAIDDLEREGANALLKSLEEPPPGTVFLLVSHAPGRLLPTIRSRCRALRFGLLDESDVREVLRERAPELRGDELDTLIRAGAGAPGRALRYAGLELAAIDNALAAIARSGDRSNAERARLAKALSTKAAQPRYEAFLDRAPEFIASHAPGRAGEELRVALDAYEEAQGIAGAARRLSLDAGATVFELAGVVARLARM